jgi:hypothetical protein
MWSRSTRRVTDFLWCAATADTGSTICFTQHPAYLTMPVGSPKWGMYFLYSVLDLCPCTRLVSDTCSAGAVDMGHEIESSDTLDDGPLQKDYIKYPFWNCMHTPSFSGGAENGLPSNGLVLILGTMLQAGRSQVRDPMRWIKFFNWPNPSSRTRGPWVYSSSNRN